MCDADASAASSQTTQFIQCLLHQCINIALLGQLWATLAYEGFDPELWGQWRLPLLELLNTSDGVDLCASAPFQKLLQPWLREHAPDE